MTVSISDSRVATITIPTTDWNGIETITFTATDPGSLSDSDDATFTVTAVNDAPVISDIENQVTTEGTPFNDFDLDDYIEDEETSDANITWTITPEIPLHLSINISPGRVVTATVLDENWNGDETITFNATDEGGETVSDDVTFTVLPLNDPPEITNIPDQEVDEGEPFTSFNLDDHIFDVETIDENIIWSLDPENPMFLDISIGPNRLVKVLAKDENWNGQEKVTFTATDEGGLFASNDATFTVLAVNDNPIVSNIPNQSILEGETFSSISLSNYVSDVETAITDIQWSYSSSLNPSNLIVDITPVKNANVSVVDENWNGSETITFKAEDGDGGSDEDAVIFEVNAVNDAPVIGDIPGESVAEGTAFATIDLDIYIDDAETSDENILWTHSNPTNYNVSISSSRDATITPVDPEWNGSESIVFTAEDEEGIQVSDGATFTVTPVNDPPVVSNIPDQTINEGNLFPPSILMIL